MLNNATHALNILKDLPLGEGPLSQRIHLGLSDGIFSLLGENKWIIYAFDISQEPLITSALSLIDWFEHFQTC